MASKYSFWNIFTTEGRLKNQWARGLTDTDRTRGLNRLRQVQQRLHQDPMKFGHLWMSFLDDFLYKDYVRIITGSDLKRLEKMGDSLVNHPSIHLQPYDIWSRIIKAYDARNEKLQANALLRHGYRTFSSNVDICKIICHHLAQRRAKGDDDLSVYVHFLNTLKGYTEEKQILDILADICNVNFDSNNALLKRAAELASKLDKHNIQLHGIQTSLGLYALQIENNPSKAIKHFQAVINTKSNEKIALTGLISALIKNGDYIKVAGLSKEIHKTTDSANIDLINFNKTLIWLDSHEIDGPSPSNTTELNALKLTKYVGEVVDIALGRLHLLEGNTKKAQELLLPLVEEYPNQQKLIYYATWATILTGDRKALSSIILPTLEKWPANWTAALLIVDFDPVYAKRNDVYKYLKTTSTKVKNIIETHMAIAEMSDPPEVLWKPGNASFEEDLEAFRTSLGYSFYKQDKSKVFDKLSMPLFQHLPLAEQMMWQGLHALLSGDNTEGQSLLQKSAVQFGNKRAAFVLAVHLLEHKRISEANQFLNIVETERKDHKTNLLRAYIDGCNGNTDKAIEQLEKHVRDQESSVRYSLGNIYLLRAEEALRAGNTDKNCMYKEQAAKAFLASLNAEKQTAPSDCKVLVRCTEFLAQPDQNIKSITNLWHEVNQLHPPRRHKWVVWNVIIALLWQGPATEAAIASEELLSLLEDVENISESLLLNIAQAVTFACINSRDSVQIEKFTKFLSTMASKWNHQSIQQLYQLSLTANIRTRYLNADIEKKKQVLEQVAPLIQKDHTNISLVLLYVHALLENQKISEASSIMKTAQSEDDLNTQLCGSLLKLLHGKALSSEDVPKFSVDIAPELAQASTLLQSVALFAENKPDKGYEALLAAMNIQADVLIQIINAANFLPSLCAYSKRGKAVPAYLTEGVRKMMYKAEADLEVLLTIARCAAAIGEIEHACYLWERILESNKDSEHPIRHEFVEFLCYLSVKEYKSKRHLEAATLLQKAANHAAIGGN